MFYELRIPFVISIHSLVKRETIGGCSVRPIVYHFNPLPRKEGDWAACVGETCSCYFNPLPRKEGDKIVFKLSFNVLYFNPLPRKEGDKIICSDGNWIFNISIHSLVKRETPRLIWAGRICVISIHSLVKRETHFRLCRSKRQLFISIHSLVKRETRLLQQQRRKICNFNPLPRKEGDFDA